MTFVLFDVKIYDVESYAIGGKDLDKKYFPGLLGNRDTASRIGKAIENKTLPHAFLISGPSGSGKSTLAREIAAAVNCSGGGNSLPCGVCNNCRRIYEGNFPDVKILEKKKDKATLGVEAVKDFREDMFLSSTESEHKIYVIDDAECMTVEAQNALLKVLEEPPKSVIIILLAKECDRILTTIKSRAQYVAMSRFTEKELYDLLVSDSIEAKIMSRDDEAGFKGIIMSSDGRLGTAKKLLDRRAASENEEERAEILNIIKSARPKSSYADIYSAVMQLPQKRNELMASLELMMSALRDLIVLKHNRTAKTVFFTDAEMAEKYSCDFSEKRLLAIYDTVSQTHDLCSKNANVNNLLICLATRLKA